MKNIFYITIALLLLLNTEQSHATVYGQKITINGEIKDGKNRKEISLIFYQDYFSSRTPISGITYVSKVTNGRFKFIIPAGENFCYIRFNFQNEQTDHLYLVKAGDLITVQAEKKKISFSGKVAERYSCQQQMTQVDYNIIYRISADRPDYTYFDAKRDNLKELLKKQKQILGTYQNKLDAKSYALLQLDIEAKMELDFLFFCSISGDYPELKKDFKKYYPDSNAVAVLDDIAAKSANYAASILSKKMLLQALSEENKNLGDTFSLGTLYRNLDKDYTGKLKEKLLLTTVLKGTLHNPDSTKYFTDQLLQTLKNPTWRELLSKEKAIFGKGALAYNFSLQDSTGKVFRRDDFRGKIVVMEFYYNGCGPCAGLNKNLKPVSEKFKDRKDVVFVSVNVDKTRKQFVDAINKEIYTHKTSVNLWTGELAEEHPLFKYYRFQACPELLIIGKDGRLLSGDPPRPLGTSGPKSTTAQFINIIEEGLNSDPNSKS